MKKLAIAAVAVMMMVSFGNVFASNSTVSELELAPADTVAQPAPADKQAESAPTTPADNSNKAQEAPATAPADTTVAL